MSNFKLVKEDVENAIKDLESAYEYLGQASHMCPEYTFNGRVAISEIANVQEKIDDLVSLLRSVSNMSLK